MKIVTVLEINWSYEKHNLTVESVISGHLRPNALPRPRLSRWSFAEDEVERFRAREQNGVWRGNIGPIQILSTHTCSTGGIFLEKIPLFSQNKGG